jgi:hypothetical protein
MRSCPSTPIRRKGEHLAHVSAWKMSIEQEVTRVLIALRCSFHQYVETIATRELLKYAPRQEPKFISMRV